MRTCFSCSGPWNHGGARADGRAIGNLQFEGDTAAWFRRTIMQPFLDRRLEGRAPAAICRPSGSMKRAPTAGGAARSGR